MPYASSVSIHKLSLGLSSGPVDNFTNDDEWHVIDNPKGGKNLYVRWHYKQGANSIQRDELFDTLISGLTETAQQEREIAFQYLNARSPSGRTILDIAYDAQAEEPLTFDDVPFVMQAPPRLWRGWQVCNHETIKDYAK